MNHTNYRTIRQRSRDKAQAIKLLSDAVGLVGFGLILHEMSKMALDIDGDIAQVLRTSRNRYNKVEKKVIRSSR